MAVETALRDIGPGEELLFRGYDLGGTDVVSSLCACGGVIVCERWRVQGAVARHNGTERHETWAIEAGWRHG